MPVLLSVVLVLNPPCVVSVHDVLYDMFVLVNVRFPACFPDNLRVANNC